MHTPPAGNQQTQQVSRDNKNGKNTSLSGLLVSSISAAVLWPLLLTGEILEALHYVRLHQKDPEGACHTFKVLTLAHDKMFKLIVLYIGV